MFNFLYTFTVVEWLVILPGITILLKFLEALLNVNGPVTKSYIWISKPLHKFFDSIKAIKTSIENLEVSGKERDTKLGAMSSHIEEIHHEVRLNSGSSIKDSVIRNESGLKNLTILVKRMCRQALASGDNDLRMRFTMDANLNCTWINKTYLETFNLQESDLENRNWEAKSIHPDDLNSVVEKWKSEEQNLTVIIGRICLLSGE